MKLQKKGIEDSNVGGKGGYRIIMATGKILDRAFPPFFDVPREKPRDMLYIANEKPDRLTTLVAGAQHVLIILMLSVYVVFVGREIGLTGAQLRSFVSIEIVVIGIATLLQSLKTRFSSGHLMIHAPNLMSIAALGVVALNFGLGAAAGAYLCLLYTSPSPRDKF